MATQQIRAAKVGISDRSSCFALPQSLSGSASCSDSSFSPHVRRPDGAAGILPARLPRQENRKLTILEARSLSAKYPATRGVTSPPLSCSAWLPVALDESSLSISSHPHRYCRHRAARSGPATGL